jgi:inner membrane protease ATP23
MADNSKDTSSFPPVTDATISSETRMFDRWRRKFGVITGLGVSDEERRRDLDEFQHERCEKWKQNLMNYSQ